MAVLTVWAVSAVMAVSVMTATPLKLNPPFRDPELCPSERSDCRGRVLEPQDENRGLQRSPDT